MADPFSIFAGALGVIDVTTRFVQYLRATTASAAHVNEELIRLLQEFVSMLELAQRIRDIYTPETSQSPRAEDADPPRLKDLKRGIIAILENCRQIAERLEKLVKDVIGKSCDIVDFDESRGGYRMDLKRSIRESKYGKKFQSFLVQLRKDSREAEFESLRARLQRNLNVLQLSIEAINQ